MQLFGAPRWRSPTGAIVAFAAERRFQLLAFLACHGGWVPRDELGALFWPDRPQSAARSNLRKVLLLAQRAIAPSVLEQRHDLLRWAPASDLHQFHEAARGGASLVDSSGAPPGELMIGLDAGMPEPGLYWLASERRRAIVAWRESIARQIAACAAAGDHTSAARLASCVLEHDPLDEDAVRALAEASLAAGQSGRARRALQAHRTALSTELGLTPGSALRELAESLPDGVEPTVERARPRLPATTGDASLIGRRLEISQLLDLAAQDACRVLTVIGPGGVGKTRLVQAVREELARKLCRELHWVALEDLHDVEAAALRVASVASVDLGIGDAWGAIARALAARPAVLVLDNAEHLAELPRVIGALVSACPALKVVLTSRSRLFIDGEWLLPVDGLPLPDADEGDTDLLERSDSVRLFVRAATALARGFDWRRQAAEVVRLVHCVEGLPLALLLAANWVRMMPVAEIVSELSASPRLLEANGVSGATARRDHSLRACFGHSWMLLIPAERQHLARLAQLPGIFDHDMAARVCDTPLAVLSALVDKSLLRADGIGHFSLHPLIRQCTLEMGSALLTDTERFRQRHAAYVGTWLYGMRERRALSRVGLDAVERRWPHVRYAWAQALAAGDPQFIWTAGTTVMFYLELRALWSEGLDWMRASADRFGDATLAERRAVEISLRALSRFEYRTGQMAQAERDARRGLKLANLLADHNGVKAHLNTIGIVLWMRGEFAKARPFFAQALQRARRDGDERDIRGFRTNIAMLDFSLGRYLDAMGEMEAVLPDVRRDDDPFALVNLLCTVASTHLGLQQWEPALRCAREALALMAQHGFAATRCEALLTSVRALRGLSRLDEAKRVLDDATGLARDSHETAPLIEALTLGALLALDDRAPARAAEHIHKAASLASSSGSVDSQLKCVAVDALRLAAIGDVASAQSRLRWAIANPAISALDRDEAARWLAQIDAGAGRRRGPVSPDEALTLDVLLAHIGALADADRLSPS